MIKTLWFVNRQKMCIRDRRYDLLFERFLNPERVSMPDIDIDFQDDRRDEVIRYVIDKYGKDHAAQIVTFNTYGPRVAMKEMGKVMGVPLPRLELIAKMIPTSPKKMCIRDSFTPNLL